MGGNVWAESEPSKGSLFHFTAWMEKSEQVQVNQFSFPFLFSKKILIVDDNSTLLEILIAVMASEGIRVTALTEGKKALPMLQRAFEVGDPFSLCCIDIQMPHMDGYQVAREIRQHYPQNLFLVALSPSWERRIHKFEETGFEAILTKPIRREKLFQTLKRFLAKETDEGLVEEVVEKRRESKKTGDLTVKSRVHVLLVEDNLVNQKVAEIILERLGCKVDVARNGFEAIRKAEASHYDLVFMDCHMPEMDGYEATLEIREREGRSKHTPIVAITALAMESDRERCLEVGMDDCIVKPIKKEVVFEMIKKFCPGEW
jgi:CheY-like chemotaxis protein